jgi:hypothetical protein
MIDIQTMLTYLTLISVPVGVVYHIITLRNQSRNRQAQLFMSIYKETQTKEAQIDFLDFDTIIMSSADDWIKLREDREKFMVLASRLSYYEGIGVLVREGLIDVGLVAKLSSGNIIWFWERYRDGVMALREHYQWPRWAVELEYLYDRIIQYAKDHPELEIQLPEGR